MITTDSLGQTLMRLEQNERYLAAFIFELRDPFINVIVDKDTCINLSHLSIEGSTIGISFVSFNQFEQALKERRENNQRPSMLDDTIIFFDKTGRLAELQEKYTSTGPRIPTQQDYQMIRFTMLWADNKIRYAIAKGDMLSANLGMHTNINDMLKMHYVLNGRWSKNDKRLLADLILWDGVLYNLLKRFLTETEIPEKHSIWNRMIDHILRPIGGRFDTMANNCLCPSCTEDLAVLMA
jgi:hypothetical protein